MQPQVSVSELLSTSKKSKESSGVKSTVENKETPSLFDSLLKKSKNTITDTDSKIPNTKTIVTQTNKVDVSNETKPLSLFDRMNATLEEKNTSINVEIKKVTPLTARVENITKEDIDKKTSKIDTPVGLKNSSSDSHEINAEIDTSKNTQTKMEDSKIVSPKLEKKSQEIDTSKNTQTQIEDSKIVSPKLGNKTVENKTTQNQVDPKNLTNEIVQVEKISTTSSKEIKADKVDVKKKEVEQNTNQTVEVNSKIISDVVSLEANDLSNEIVKPSTLEKINLQKDNLISDKKVAQIVTQSDILVDKPLGIKEQEGTTLLDKIVASIQKVQKKDFIDEVEFRVEEKNLDAAVLSKGGVFYKESVKDLEPKELILMNKYVAEQKKQKDLTAQSAIESAKKVLAEENGTEGIKKAAQILELSPSEIKKEELQKEEGIKSSTESVKGNNFNKDVQNVLHRAYLKENISEKQVEQEIMQNNKKAENEQSEKSLGEDKTKDIKNVEVKLERSAIEVFTTKIVASKQKLETFMSDVARQMYLNYKPPITAFRINLNPANLGTIAILIKNNKSENSLNVSMNITKNINLNPANLGTIAILIKNNKSENSLNVSMNITKNDTFDVLNENRNQLQNNIARTFANEGEVSLDLSFNENNNNEFESMYQEQLEQQLAQNNDNSEDIIPQSASQTVDNSDYM